MGKMTGGAALAKSVLGHGVDTIFALPGVQIDHLFNALHDEGDGVRVIHSRHEQGAAYMAFGYAASTGRVGTYAVVPGPGFLNSAAALSTAYACNAPVLCLTGQIPSAHIGEGLGHLHEIPDQLAVARSLTKWAARIEKPGDAPVLVREAFRQLLSGRRRPVELEMAMDVMGAKAEVELLAALAPDAAPDPDPDLVAEAAALLGRAERPLIMAGGGVNDAGPALTAVAEALQAPVVSLYNGRGALDGRHYLSQNWLAGHRLWADADVVLAVGTRLHMPRAMWGVDDGLKIVRIDIDPEEMKRQGAPDVALVADANDGLTALAGALGKSNRKRANREPEMAELRARAVADMSRLEPQLSYVRAIREALPEDGILVDDVTQIGYAAWLAYPVYAPRTYISSGYQGTLGYGFATALGVQVAHPERKVVSVSGDGGFMFNVQELATAVHHGIGLVAVVFRDNAFGNVKRIQRDMYGGRELGVDLTNPDFVSLAENFGARGLRAKSPDELRAALETAFGETGPTVIEVPVSEMPDPWPLILLPRARPPA